MASKINSLIQDTTFPRAFSPNEVISLRDYEPLVQTQPSNLHRVEETIDNTTIVGVEENHRSSESHPGNNLEGIESFQANNLSYQPDDELEDSLATIEDIMPLPDVPALAGESMANDTDDTDIERLKSLAAGSREVLISVNTVLPVMINPNSLIVDRQKLTIVHRTYLGSTDTISVQMDDINNVEAFIGPFFGEIRIYSKYFINNVQKLAGLWRKDAIAVRRLVQGYMIAHHRGIDCATIEKDQLVTLLTELGRGSR